MASNKAFEQIGAMDLSTLANIATAFTVLTAVVFGLVEMRRARKDREERAAFVAVQAILTPAWINSMTLVQAIAEGTTPSQIEADPRLFQAVQSIACILESLGYAVFARMVPLNVVDELLGGTVRVAWRNLRGYVDYERERAGSQKNWEWFQWLAEQMDRHSKAATSLGRGAHDAYRDWRP
jgi:predicted outer membrane lipoprotein